MDRIIEHFSEAGIDFVVGAAMVGMLISLLTIGVLHTGILDYMQSICG